VVLHTIKSTSFAAGLESALGFWIGQWDSLDMAPYAQVPLGADQWRVMLNPMTVEFLTGQFWPPLRSISISTDLLSLVVRATVGNRRSKAMQ
jgi:hypothetical protein